MNDPGAGYLVVDTRMWVARLVPQDGFHLRVKTWMETRRSIARQALDNLK